MDNNQQDVNPVQASGTPANTTPVIPHTEVSQAVTNLNINEPKIMTGNSVQSPFSGQDVSMTTGQPFGGPIVSTEVEPNVRNEAGPY
jgi:hypothetical protein